MKNPLYEGAREFTPGHVHDADEGQRQLPPHSVRVDLREREAPVDVTTWENMNAQSRAVWAATFGAAFVRALARLDDGPARAHPEDSRDAYTRARRAADLAVSEHEKESNNG